MRDVETIFRKDGGRPIIGLSIYDYFGAYLIRGFQDIDFILVGDSLGMVIQGRRDTRQVTIDHMLYHLEIVKRAVGDKPVFLDMPYGSYENAKSMSENIERIRGYGVEGVMIEGVYIESMKLLRDEGIPFIVHLGYMPKHHLKPSVVRDYNRLYMECLKSQENGAIAIKLELVDSEVARRIQRKMDIPVLGVGSGPHVDGHILVLYDFLGMTPWFKAKFVRRYVDFYKLGREAVSRLIEDIKEGRYPSEQESY